MGAMSAGISLSSQIPLISKNFPHASIDITRGQIANKSYEISLTEVKRIDSSRVMGQRARN